MRIKSNILLISTFILLLASVFFFSKNYSDFVNFFSQQKKINPLEAKCDFDSSEKIALFHGKKCDLPSLNLAQDFPPLVLGESNAPKRIEVDLTNQRLYAFEGDRQIYNFLVSTGKWGRTPTGAFQIWSKFRYTKMEGGSKALRTYYYLPNVPYVMFFYNSDVAKYKGFSLHGTYWHKNFGHPMSHGCVNMKTEEVAQLYYWANPDLKGKQSIAASSDNPGTNIIIYGDAPKE